MPRDPSICIIDDDESLRLAMVGLVRSFGYGATGFDSAEAFLADEGARGCDCIVTDIQMPGLSGIELKQRLDREGCTAPVIMVTARAEAGLRERAMAGGAFCFLGKPFASEDLIACLERALVARA